MQRFGLDPANGDVDISMFMFDPRNNYRAYVVGGEAAPSSGWVVRDGGWNATRRVSKSRFQLEDERFRW